MIAFVIKDQQGSIKNGWILQGGRPSLSINDLQLIEKRGCYLTEVLVEEALSGKPLDNQHPLEQNITDSKQTQVPYSKAS